MRLLLTLRRASLGLLIMLALGVTACASTSTTSTTQDAPTGGGSTPGADTGSAGDEPNVVYRSPTGAFSFSHPQSWTQATQPHETVRFTGRDEFISVTIVNTNLNPADYANSDHAALVAASPGFQGHTPTAIHLTAGDGVMVAYTWDAGPSPVTGKMAPSSANRIYIPGPQGTLAMYTYSAPNQVYDPYGAVDFVNTFRWS